MTDASLILALVKEYTDIEDMKAEEILPLCQRALDFVYSKLKPLVDKELPIVAETAAAVARYYIISKRLGETRRFQKYKVGDVSMERNIEKELAAEKQLYNEALANAAEILKDGGFYFSAE
ncbi:MAG: hypothetical protein ACI4SB_05225 [Acutalibacteraceae bacterium]